MPVSSKTEAWPSPPNQRAYAWKEEHVTDLFQDLAKAIADREKDYFLGSVVVAKKDSDLQVFDGQQRLATTIILLSAFRNYLKRVGDDTRAELIEQQFVMSVDLDTLEISQKFRLSNTDNDFFLKHILSPVQAIRDAARQATPSHKRIKDAGLIAAAHVENIIAPLHDSAKTSQILSWINFLKEAATVICVQVADDAGAYIVFETMNDRGLRPSAADLLKNHLFGSAHNRLPEAENAWTAMVAVLENIPNVDDDIVVTYIRHFWISEYGPTRTKALFDDIKKKVKSKQEAIDLVKKLEENADIYAAILNPSHEKWNQYGPDARKHIDTLKNLGVEQMRPLLVAALKKFPQGEIARFLLNAVCWGVRLLITGKAGSGTLESIYGRNAHLITSGQKDDNDLAITNTDQLTSAMAATLPPDDEFSASFRVVQVPKPHLAKYYLRALQRNADGEREPQYVPNDGTDINLEHILPQSPSNDWKLSVEEMKANHKRLGNLVLLQSSENTAAGNSGFSLKKAMLANSAYSLTKMVASDEVWTSIEINKRQERLAELAVKTWPLKS